MAVCESSALVRGAAETTLGQALAFRLRDARRRQGLRAPVVAKELGWSESRLYRFEQGNQVPDAIELVALSERLRVPVSFLLSRDFTDVEGRLAA